MLQRCGAVTWQVRRSWTNCIHGVPSRYPGSSSVPHSQHACMEKVQKLLQYVLKSSGCIRGVEWSDGVLLATSKLYYGDKESNGRVSAVISCVLSWRHEDQAGG
ncbi:uncharacterized protein AAGF69_001986 [Amazona ochrocephala]